MRLPVPPIRDADCLPGAVLFVTVTWTRLCTGQATVLGNVNGKVLFFFQAFLNNISTHRYQPVRLTFPCRARGC